MGITKQYLRYVPGAIFNTIATSKCNVLFVKWRESSGWFVACGASEHVYVWDVRKGEKVYTLMGGKSEATVITKSLKSELLAVGYNDGALSLFNLRTGAKMILFQGHKSTVTCLDFDDMGSRIASGAKDTDIVVWDVISESGLFRLRGHKGVVTCCKFIRGKNVLVSSSKDTFIKFWDLDTQHCFKTLTGHHCEVWNFVLTDNPCRIITGSSDKQLRIWDICDSNISSDNLVSSSDDKEEMSILNCVTVGSLQRAGHGHVISLNVDDSNFLLASLDSSNSLEVFKLKFHVVQNKTQKDVPETASDAFKNNVHLTSDQLAVRLGVIKLKSKIKAFDFFVEDGNIIKFVILLSDNSLELHDMSIADSHGICQMTSAVKNAAHRTDVRTLCFSSDNTAILSASGESVKIWNKVTQQCIRTMQCDYALCSLFVPGDRHCVIGTKTGKLQIFDISGNMLLEEVSAHLGSVWSVCLMPNKRGFASGGADKQVKFWEFQLMENQSISKSKVLSISHTRTLQLTEDVVCIKFSDNDKYLAVSLLDSTVKIFFVDTLKFFLTLYGHKFPVLCMDITDDSTLIVTGSADRSVKIWGLDFGDCHKSLFAHSDSIMCLQVIPKTHMFFTGGKDGMLKMWDADNFQRISSFKIHHAEVWALAVSFDGKHVASSSHDKSIRMLMKSDEILVLDEEQEMEREEEFEQGLTGGEETVFAGESNTEVGLASQKTADSLKGAEKVMEALIIYKEETAKLEKYKMECSVSEEKLTLPPSHPLMAAYNSESPAHFMLHILKQIKASELEETLLVLPFTDVVELINVLTSLLSKKWNVELLFRALFFLLRMHHGQISSNNILLPVIDNMRKTTVDGIQEMKDMVGFNLAGLQFLRNEIESRNDVQIFLESTREVNKRKSKRKKKELRVKHALLTL